MDYLLSQSAPAQVSDWDYNSQIIQDNLSEVEIIEVRHNKPSPKLKCSICLGHQQKPLDKIVVCELCHSATH
jgi:hypothetical protein